jgi:hypothetical protein
MLHSHILCWVKKESNANLCPSLVDLVVLRFHTKLYIFSYNMHVDQINKLMSYLPALSHIYGFHLHLYVTPYHLDCQISCSSPKGR